MKNRTIPSTLAIFACAALALPHAANAHHAMGKATPATLFQGLLSGLAHPVIGLDHLLFVLAVGAVCCYFGRGAGTVLAFIGGTLAGTLAHLYKASLPYPDLWVASSLVVVGILVFRGRSLLASNASTVILGLCGIAHGYAYGESIFGAETTPLVAYLAGFTLVQLAIVFAGYGAARFAQTKLRETPSAALGAALSVAGVVFFALALP